MRRVERREREPDVRTWTSKGFRERNAGGTSARRVTPKEDRNVAKAKKAAKKAAPKKGGMKKAKKAAKKSAPKKAAKKAPGVKKATKKGGKKATKKKAPASPSTDGGMPMGG
jgi:hypothetical protein